MVINYIICYNLCTMKSEEHMNKKIFITCKNEIDKKVDEILDKEIEKYLDN